MKRKGRPPKDGIYSDAGPKCANCRSKRGKCLAAAAVAAGNALLSPGEPSTSERPRPQAAADSDMDDAEPRPSRERKAPERIVISQMCTNWYHLGLSQRIEVDELRSRATGTRKATNLLLMLGTHDVR